MKSDGNFFEQDAFNQGSSTVTTDVTTPCAQEEESLSFQVYISSIFPGIFQVHL